MSGVTGSPRGGRVCKKVNKITIYNYAGFSCLGYKINGMSEGEKTPAAGQSMGNRTSPSLWITQKNYKKGVGLGVRLAEMNLDNSWTLNFLFRDYAVSIEF